MKSGKEKRVTRRAKSDAYIIAIAAGAPVYGGHLRSCEKNARGQRFDCTCGKQQFDRGAKP